MLFINLIRINSHIYGYIIINLAEKIAGCNQTIALPLYVVAKTMNTISGKKYSLFSTYTLKKKVFYGTPQKGSVSV
jgi:hypothetical protein